MNPAIIEQAYVVAERDCQMRDELRQLQGEPMLHTFTFFNEDISIFAEAVRALTTEDHPIDAKVVESLNKKLTIPGGKRLLTTAELQVIVSAMAVLEFHGWEIKANRAAEAVINDNRCEESAKGLPAYLRTVNNGYSPMERFRYWRDTFTQRLTAAAAR
jgi:hypothetical protein